MPEEKIPLSVIIPVYNAARELRECLSALLNSSRPGVEIMVVDDGSTDDTPAVARQMGVQILRLEKNSGPAAARNHGARYAKGEILFFVDADVVVAPGLVSRVPPIFAERPEMAAVFGSYDAFPRAPGIVSQYRNLLHHYVHQGGEPEASTFWAGCGAIRRSVFETVGGFNESRFPRPSIEDIELGYRLRGAGYRIRLEKDLQGTHLKRWTLWSVIHTDIQRRAIPWAHLMLESKLTPNDLNVKTAQRFSGALVLLTCVFFFLGILRVELLGLAGLTSLAVIFLNRDLYRFFLRHRGALFATACIPLHFLYFFYSTLSYLFVWATFHLKFIGTHWLARCRGNRSCFHE
jgi:GT2 family glycosyltransferase